MTECGKKLKLYNVEVKDKNFYFKNPVKLPKGTELGNDISNKTKDISATTHEDCQGKGVGKGASSIEIKDGKCVFYDDNINTENNCGDKCYQLKIKNFSDYKKRNGKEIDVGMDDNDGFLIYKQSDYKCNCKNGGYFKNNVCTEYTKTQQQCSSQNRPFVSGTKTADSKCGNECGSDFYFSSTANKCKKYATTPQQCYSKNRPFISGTETTDSKCGDECGSGFYFSSTDNVCKQNVTPSTQIEQIVYNFDTLIEHEETKYAMENTNTYKCDTISDTIYNSKKDAENACLKNDKCTGIYDISCNSSQFKLCGGKLDSGCANRKVSGYNINGKPALCNRITSVCNRDVAQERCPETCKVEKCIGNSLKYDLNGCVYRKTSVELEDCHSSGQILDYTIKKCQPCDPGTFLDKTTNNCVTKGVSNKNILKKPITTYKWFNVKRNNITNQKLKQLLLLNGPIVVSLKLDDPVTKQKINAKNCPHKIFDIPKLGEGQRSNHDTVLVGYGQVNDNKQSKVNYWIIANSWGGEYKKWGNYGFFAVRMTKKLFNSFSQIRYIECKRKGPFVNPGVDINEENLKNATQHNLSKDIINNMYFRDDVCPQIDNTEYATGSKENTNMLQNFYSSVTGDQINDDTYNEIPELYKHNFSWADPQQNPFRQSFVSTINDQMSCGSCWAFASSYLLQSLISIQYYLKYKESRNIHLSVRSVIENRNENPCVGGNMYDYISLINKYGVVPEKDCQYPCNYRIYYKLKNKPRWTYSKRIRCSQYNFDRGAGQLVISYPENLQKVTKIVDRLKNKTYTNLKYEKINGNLEIEFDFDGGKCITENFTEKSKITSCPADDNNNYIVYLIIGIVVVVLIVIFIFWFRKKKK